MTTISVQDIPTSLKCLGNQRSIIPAGLSTYFQNAQYMLFGAWAKCVRAQDGATFRDIMLFVGDSGSSTFAGLFFMSNSEGVGISGLGYSGTVVPVPINTWVHVVAELDIAAVRGRIWVNGVKGMDLVATFSRNLATVNAVPSYIGDNSATGFEGNIANCFIQRRSANATDEEIFDIYAKGMLPKSDITFMWKCDDSVGSSLICTDTNGDIPITHTAFVGVNTTSSMFSLDTPMKGRMADRNAGTCIFLDGVADYYITPAVPVAVPLFGKRCIQTSYWVRLNAYPGASSGIYLPDGGGVTALSLLISPAGVVQSTARSRTGGTAGGSGSSGSWASRLPLNEWHHIFTEMDFATKISTCYVDGLRVGIITAIAWEDTVFTIVPINNVLFGFSAGYLPGYMDDIIISYSARPSIPTELRNWFLSGILPSHITPVLNLDCNDAGIDLIDKSAAGFICTPVSITVPYGIYPISYMD